MLARWSTLLLLSVVAAAPPSSLAASPRPLGASLCQIGLHDVGIPDQCLPPPRIVSAESKMSVNPVRPVDSVARIAHLHLVQLELRRPRRPLEIRYLFGRIPLDQRRRPDLGSRVSHYVIVGELVGLSNLSKPRLFFYKSAEGRIAYVSWAANFRCHDLSLNITSNLQGRLIRSLGRSILNAEVCGK